MAMDTRMRMRMTMLARSRMKTWFWVCMKQNTNTNMVTWKRWSKEREKWHGSVRRVIGSVFVRWKRSSCTNERGMQVGFGRSGKLSCNCEKSNGWDVTVDPAAWDVAMEHSGGDDNGGKGRARREVVEGDDNERKKRHFSWWYLIPTIVLATGGAMHVFGIRLGGPIGSTVRLIFVWVWVFLTTGIPEFMAAFSQLFNPTSDEEVGDDQAQDEYIKNAETNGNEFHPESSQIDESSLNSSNQEALSGVHVDEGEERTQSKDKVTTLNNTSSTNDLRAAKEKFPYKSIWTDLNKISDDRQSKQMIENANETLSTIVPISSSMPSIDIDSSVAVVSLSNKSPKEACIEAANAAVNAAEAAKVAFRSAVSASTAAELAVEAMNRNKFEEALVAAAESTEASKWAVDYSSISQEESKKALNIEKQAQEYVKSQQMLHGSECLESINESIQEANQQTNENQTSSTK